MFFVLSKLFELVFSPANLLVWLIVLTAVLLALGRTRAGTRAAVTTAVLAVLFAFLPLGTWLLRPLENAYPRPPLPAHIDGILVLGGGLHTQIWLSRHAPAEEESEGRLVSAYALARQHPEAKVVFTGGSGALAGGRPEAVAARLIFEELGLDPHRLVLEGRSQNTWQNLVFSRARLHPKKGEVWVLATTADHLPRAMGIARAVGWPMLPWATDYLTAARGGAPILNPIRNLTTLEHAFHEWVGIAVYRLSGRWSAQREPPARQ